MISIKNKKAGEVTVGTIIVIVLALAVLVFLIFAFTRGGGSLMDYITNIFGAASNIDTIKNTCSTSCAARAAYAYCEEIRILRYNRTHQYNGTCESFTRPLSPEGVSISLDSCGEISCATHVKACRIKPEPVTCPS